MKPYILLGILCLFMIGTAAAATINPALAKQTIQQSGVAASTLHTATITFDSNVHGATVYLDGALAGADEAGSKTTMTVKNVASGDHTAMFRLTGYRDNVMTFHVEGGQSQTIYARLQPSSIVAERQEITRVVTLQMQNITIRPVTATATATTAFATTTPPPTRKSVAPVSVGSDIVQQGIGGEVASRGGGSNPPIEPLQQVAAAPPAITHIGVIDSLLDSLLGGIFGRTASKPALQVNTKIPGALASGNFSPDSYYIVAPQIGTGANVYIGEQDLDITSALIVASGTPLAATPPITTIGKWPAGATDDEKMHTPPMKTVDLSSRYTDMTIDPTTFVGYYGWWYLVDPQTGGASTLYPVFNVVDPSLHIEVRNSYQNSSSYVGGTNVGSSATRGDNLSFFIVTDIGINNGEHPRWLLHGTPDDGFLDIVVQDPSGNILSTLQATNGWGSWIGPQPLTRVCWMNTPGPCVPEWRWRTAALNTSGKPLYPAGTYTVRLVSKLNNMNNNYKNGGQPYIGKTVSADVTFTLKEKLLSSQIPINPAPAT